MEDSKPSFNDVVNKHVAKHLVQAYIDALYEAGRRVFVSFFADHIHTVISPQIHPTKFQEQVIKVVRDGNIQDLKVKTLTLNISFDAINNYKVGDIGLEFQCRFNGTLVSIVIPFESITHVFDPDDSIKVAFGFSPNIKELRSDVEVLKDYGNLSTGLRLNNLGEPTPPEPEPEPEPPKPSRNHLRVIK